MKNHFRLACIFSLLICLHGNTQDLDFVNATLRMGESRSQCLVDIRDTQLSLDDEGCNVDFWIVNLNGSEIMGSGNKLSMAVLKKIAELPEGAPIEIQAFSDVDQTEVLVASGRFIYTRIINLPELRFYGTRLI